MSLPSVEFLKAMRRGLEPEALVEAELDKVSSAVHERSQETLSAVAAAQQSVERGAIHLLKKYNQEELNPARIISLQGNIAAQKTAQSEQIQKLVSTAKELKEAQEKMGSATNRLQCMQSRLRNPPSPYNPQQVMEATLQVGHLINASRKTAK